MSGFAECCQQKDDKINLFTSGNCCIILKEKYILKTESAPARSPEELHI